MKKITLIAAILGTTYFANAQVGIGTADPATSTELDIVARDKGILIPRVTLTAENVFTPIKGAQIESLLVYNSVESKAMPKGFYYWDGAKWNRIIGKTELDKVVENLGDNITNITNDVQGLKNIVNFILPTNPGNVDKDGKPVVDEKHTTIVYDHTTGDMYEVVYEGGKYITKKIDLQKMIQGKETNTFFKEIKEGGKTTGYVYFNEKTIVEAIGTETDPLKIKEILDKLDKSTKGAIEIDVKGTVVNNFKEILEAPTTITVTTKEGDKTFTTVEEYLQYISQSAEGNVIYKNISTDPAKEEWVFQYYDKTTEKYKTISLRDLVAGTETKTFVREIEVNGKVTGFVYFSEQTIIDWLALDKDKNTVDNIPNNAKGAVTVDVKGTIVKNIQEILKSTTEVKEGGKTFTTVEQYLQYISQSAEGNVIYKNISTDPAKEEWVFQYYDKTTGEYKTIVLRDLVAGAESKTTIVTYNNKQYYLSEAYIIAGGELDSSKWTAVPAGAIHVDVVGGVINNIEEILTTKGNITIKVGGKDMSFTSVEEYLQYITQFSEGNVIYTQIEDPKDATKKVWVFQYYDKTTGKYVTIKLEDLVAGFETKTNILRTEAKADGKLEAYAEAVAPVETAVKKGEIFYKYNNEDKKEQYINMTADIISSINNNEEVKNALTNILNQGGNVYFGKINSTDKEEVFYTMKIVNGKEEKTPIELPASFILDIINKYKDIVKNALGDHISDTTTIVNTGNTYNGKMVFLAKGKTTVGKEEDGVQYPSPLTTGVTLDLTKIAGLTTIEDVLTVSILKNGKVVASTVADLESAANKLTFSIGTGAFYTALPYGEYEVVVEFTGNLSPMTPITKP